MKAIDPDGDGTVSLDEAKAAAEADFKKADPDGDGTLDAKELKSAAGQSMLKLVQ